MVRGSGKAASLGARSQVVRRESQSWRSTLRTFGRSFAHLAALSAFAVAQPLFNLLGESPDFFAVRGSSRWDIVLFALAVVLVPPVALVLLEAAASLVSWALQRVLHLVFVAGLAAVVIVQALERATDVSSTNTLVALAALLGAVVALLYWRFPPARSFLTVLSPAPIFFLAYFLFVSPVSQLTLGGDPDVALANTRAQAPVVMVVFDEFPVSSLLDETGEIDAARYPNFAELAAGSTWFRNTSTVSYSTTQAVPAMLTGLRPTGGRAPVFSSHPRNLFTLLGGDYRMNVVETYTRLCPKVVCSSPPPAAAVLEEPASLYSDVGIVYLHLLAPPRLEETLPPITQDWMNFGREEDEDVGKLLDEALTEAAGKRPQAPEQYHSVHTRLYKRFVESIRPTDEPSLNFAHVFFPHGPWWHFPSGSQSSIGPAPAPGLDGPKDLWKGRFLTHQAYQRHLLQVGFVDRLIGDLLDRLRETDMYDESLVVVTADHGVSFRPGESRRGATQVTLPDIAFVPLFVKQPGQEQGEVVDYHVEILDVLPTIAEALGITMPWRINGRSALQDPRRGTVRVRTRPREAADGETEAPFATVVQRQEAAISRKATLFGVGDWARLFAVDPHRDLRGRLVETLDVVGSSADRATIDHEATRRLAASMPVGLPFVPSPLQGHVTGAGARPGRPLALVVNGRVAALATTYAASGGVRFSALPPESAFQNRRNVISFYWVDGPVGAARLTRLRSG
jgi:hypothetical protein